jgi:hypothetical protein
VTGQFDALIRPGSEVRLAQERHQLFRGVPKFTRQGWRMLRELALHFIEKLLVKGHR